MTTVLSDDHAMIIGCGRVAAVRAESVDDPPT
jgi:hypothetical protein